MKYLYEADERTEFDPRFSSPIITFREMHEAEYKDEYKYLIYVLLQKKTLPLGKLNKYVYEDICVQDIEFKTIRLNRISNRTFRFSSVIQVIFSVATVSGCITVSEWYIVPGQYDVKEGTSLFQNIDIYNSTDAPHSDMTLHLIPWLSNFEAEAKAILSEFQPDVLEKSYRVDAESLAKAMGYSIRYVRLSADSSVQGKIIFSKAILKLYNENGDVYIEEIEENTILIDKEACKKYGGSVRTAIIHECIHAFEHYLFFDLQKAYCERMEEYAGQSFEDFLQNNEAAFCVRLMEQQAARLTPRVLMPEETFVAKAKEYLAFYTDFSLEVQMERTIRALADFFDASVDMTKHRMQELGFQAQGVLEYADGRYVPHFHADANIPINTTYTVPLIGLMEEAERNADFDKLLTSGRYIYVESHLCIRDEKYVASVDGKLMLTGYAHAHLNECCLLFEVCHRSSDTPYISGVLNKASSEEPEYHHSTEYYQDLLAEIKESRAEVGRVPDTFFDAFVYYKKKKKYSNLVISLVSHIAKSRVDRIANSNEQKRQHPCYYDATALGMTLCPTPDLVIDLTEKAGYCTYQTVEQRFITRCVYALFGRDIDDFNFAMTSAGFKPLVEETEY
ncbi:MAG: hypothetical protein IJB68_00915 [Ruminococcus sp.]|nr:hypothetical protein [Ruminococcus sp.]